jgi:hypothetical protein
MTTKKPSLTIALTLSLSLFVAAKPAAADVSIEIISRSDAASAEADYQTSLPPSNDTEVNQPQDGSQPGLNASRDRKQSESQTIDDDFEGILIRI